MFKIVHCECCGDEIKVLVNDCDEGWICADCLEIIDDVEDISNEELEKLMNEEDDYAIFTFGD